MRYSLLDPVPYKVEETALGVWRRFAYEDSEEYRKQVLMLEGQLDRYVADHPILGPIATLHAHSAVRATAHFGSFEEFISHRRLFGLPLLHYTRGRCQETGRRKWACGIVAVGEKALGVLALGRWFAVGLLALGWVSAGIVAVGQLGIGLLFGLGQGTTGVIAIGQLAIGLAFGLGQFATGFIAIGQIAAGYYVLAQKRFGRFVWDMSGCSPVARQFFESLIP